MQSPMQNPDPGALPREKLDNRPAKLSEGEYVLPAEVVRFYGLEKIESMVNKAKDGLMAMQEQGRMKNPPQQPPQGPPPGAGGPAPMPPRGAPQRGPMPPSAGGGVPPGGPTPPIPGMADGGMVRTTLPDGRTVFMPAAVNFRPGHTVLGGKSAMQRVEGAQQTGAADTASGPTNGGASDTTGEGLNPGGESDKAGTNSTEGKSYGSVTEMMNDPDFVSQAKSVMGLFSAPALAATIAKGIAESVEADKAIGGMASAKDDPGTPGAPGSGGDTGTGKDAVGGDAVGSGVEGGLGTTGGHDDGGEDSGSDSTDGSESAAAGGGSASEAGNDADGDGNSDTGLKDGGFIRGMKLPPAVNFRKKVTKKK